MFAIYILILAILFVIIGLVSLMLAYTVKIMMLRNKYRHLPGPPGSSFFFGNFNVLQKIQRDETTFGEAMFDLHQEYGSVVVMYFFNVAMVSVADPVIVKKVLMDNKFLKPPENYVIFVELFGERFGGYNLVSETNHEKWARHRRVINPAFHRQYLMQLMDTFNDSADRMVKFLATQADHGKAEVSMLDAIERVTLDVIAKAGFSMEEDLITNKSEFNDAVSFILAAARRNSIDIFVKYSPFKEARDYRAKTKKAIHLLRDTAERMIRQRLKDQQEGKKLPKDILSYIIKTAMVDESFQMVEMVDEFVTFFGAGQETTGNLLSFTLVCLGQNPHVLEKVLEEIETVIGDKQDLLYEDIAKLEYMMLVFKETLRLCPPVIGTARTTPEELLCAGHRIPAGTMVLLPSFAMSRQEQFFKDPLTFDPERFQRNEDSPLYAYFPFSMGARSCIGQQFALIEARVVLVKLFQKLHLKWVPGQKLGMLDRLTVRPSSQCLHYITERVKSA